MQGGWEIKKIDARFIFCVPSDALKNYLKMMFISLLMACRID